MRCAVHGDVVNCGSLPCDGVIHERPAAGQDPLTSRSDDGQPSAPTDESSGERPAAGHTHKRR